MPPDRDVLVRVTVAKRPGDFTYLSVRNSRTDFPVLACALSRMEGEYRAVYGARPGRAMVVRDGDGILSGESARTAPRPSANTRRRGFQPGAIPGPAPPTAPTW